MEKQLEHRVSPHTKNAERPPSQVTCILCVPDRIPLFPVYVSPKPFPPSHSVLMEFSLLTCNSLLEWLADTNLERQEVDEGFLGQVNLEVKGKQCYFRRHNGVLSRMCCVYNTLSAYQQHCTSSQEVPKVSFRCLTTGKRSARFHWAEIRYCIDQVGQT